MVYKIVVLLHVLFVLGFLLSHGVSVSVAFALKKERDINRVRTLLDLSAASYPMMMGLFWAFIFFGFLATYLGNWWGRGWVWVSVILAIAIFVLMAMFGGSPLGVVRKAAGMRYNSRGKWFPPESASSNEEVFGLLATLNPVLLTIIGYGGFIIITWLMTAKPF